MKRYEVTLEVRPFVDREKIEIVKEIVEYPRLDPRFASSCINESEREEKAIQQYLERAGNGWDNVRATHSHSIEGHCNDTVLPPDYFDKM